MKADVPTAQVLRVRTGSRLHFGFFSLPGDGGAHVAARDWGGAGLMVQQPGFVVEARPAGEWSAEGEQAARVRDYVERFLSAAQAQQAAPLRFTIVQAAREHQGLGTGTQLGLAVARLLAEHLQLPEKSADTLARRVGRGRRSAVGIHGFDRGGLLVEGGKRHGDDVAPLVARAAFPTEWRVVLIFPGGAAGLHGADEVEAFCRLRRSGHALPTDRACRLVLLGLLPALAERDLPAFGDALYEFNRLSGAAFLPVQGDLYAHPRSAAVVAFLRQQGVRGVGQSSWGPALFAIAGDEDEARSMRQKLRERFAFADAEMSITEALNEGAHLEIER